MPDQKISRNFRGWIPDLPDHRDIHKDYREYTLNEFGEQEPKPLPASVDLRPGCAPVYNQGDLGSCTANAIAGALQYDQIAQKETPVMPSRLFIYYNERAMEGTTDTDSGAQIRDGVKAVNSIGVCPETDWPYEPTQFAVKPSASCYNEAAKMKSVAYHKVSYFGNLKSVKAALAAGRPVVFGFTVFESFESESVAETGVMPVPGVDESILGGHAVLAVGYDDNSQHLIVRNSWGPTWGDKGYFYMPYSYIEVHGLATDFWVINTVE